MEQRAAQLGHGQGTGFAWGELLPSNTTCPAHFKFSANCLRARVTLASSELASCLEIHRPTLGKCAVLRGLQCCYIGRYKSAVSIIRKRGKLIELHW